MSDLAGGSGGKRAGQRLGRDDRTGGDELAHAEIEGRGGGKRNSAKAAAAKGSQEGRHSQDVAGGDELAHAEIEGRGGGKRNSAKAAAAKGSQEGRHSQDVAGGDELAHAEIEGRGGGKRNSAKAAAAKDCQGERHSQDVAGGDEMAHAEIEGRGGGKRNSAKAAAAKDCQGERHSQDVAGGDEMAHAEIEGRGGGKRNSAKAAAAKDSQEGRQSQDVAGGDEMAHAEIEGRGGGKRNSAKAAAAKDSQEGRHSQDVAGGDELALPETVFEAGIASKRGGGGIDHDEDDPAAVTDGKEQGHEAVIAYKRRKDVDSGSRDRKARQARQGPKKYVSSSSGSDEGSSDSESGSSSGSEEVYEDEDEEEEESEDGELEPESEDGEEARPLKKRSGASKRLEHSAAAAANDGGAGGVWANALGECGGGVDGSMWDMRESMEGGNLSKMEPATKEGRGESMGTPGASNLPNQAGGMTVEQLMRELARRDREIADLKARPGSKGPVKPCTPPSRPPPLASLSSGPSAGGRSPGVAPESPVTEDQRVRRPHGMPTPKNLRVSVLLAAVHGAGGGVGGMWRSDSRQPALSTPRYPPSFHRSSLPSPSHPSPSSHRAPVHGAGGAWVACGASPGS
ncbi:unnamed protein product, partial [Closterium sp. Naga37s-1]